MHYSLHDKQQHESRCTEQLLNISCLDIKFPTDKANKNKSSKITKKCACAALVHYIACPKFEPSNMPIGPAKQWTVPCFLDTSLHKNNRTSFISQTLAKEWFINGTAITDTCKVDATYYIK